MRLLAAAALAVAIGTPALADVTPADIPPETKTEIKARCEAKWRDHADKYMMTAYCIDKEVEAWAKVQNF